MLKTEKEEDENLMSLYGYNLMRFRLFYTIFNVGNISKNGVPLKKKKHFYISESSVQ